MSAVEWRRSTLAEVNPLLAERHYLGPVRSGGAKLVVAGVLGERIVAAQVWRHPTSRRLPNGSWLELSRWCLTPEAGANAGSRQHRVAVRMIRDDLPEVRALVSYSDPTAGHTGSLYRACNWVWRPTWHRLRTPPTGNGNWNGRGAQAVKDRWVFFLSPDEGPVSLDDQAAIRFWRVNGTESERRWARSHPQLSASVVGSAP